MTRRTKPDTQQTVRAVLADVVAELARKGRATVAPAGSAGTISREGGPGDAGRVRIAIVR